ncbi:MAG: DUF4842 domain-containing protein [Duncaniella sp.]|nr:DUF4842 domain-containing protein [Duncaniella sp.]
MNIKQWLTPALLLCGAVFTSCVDDIPGPDAKELYARQFIRDFGIAAPDHDFSMAKQSGVTVVTTSPADLKVYAKVNGKNYLFAEAHQVNGTTSIPFCIPKDVEEVTVKADGKTYTAKAGGTVVLDGAARVVVDEKDIDVKEKKDWVTWTVTDEKIFHTDLVDEHIGLYKENVNNLDKGPNSFYFVGDGKYHTFYPFYWNTNAFHCLGIYKVYKDASGKVMVDDQDLYYTKSGELSVSTQYKPGYEIIHEAGSFPYINKVDEYNSTEFLKPDDCTGIPFYVYEGDEKVILTNDNWAYSSWTDLITTKGVWTPWGEYDQRMKEGYITFTEESAEFYTPTGYISRIDFDPETWGGVFRFTECIPETTIEEVPADDDPSYWERAHKNFEQNEAYAPTANTYVKTVGISYMVEAGVPYGFYIKVAHPRDLPQDQQAPPSFDKDFDYDYILFSHAPRNETYEARKGLSEYYGPDGERFTDTDVNIRVRKAPWGVDMESGKYEQSDNFSYSSWGEYPQEDGQSLYIFAFEDCAHGYWREDVPDLNDVMFLFDDDVDPKFDHDDDDVFEKEEGDVFEWLIAAEDLGGSYDWDFNDVVFSVKAKTVVTGGGSDDSSAEATETVTTTEITVTPLASGGTLPVYIMFDGTIDGKEGCYHIGSELHEWFGRSNPRGSLQPVINAGTQHTGLKAASVSFVVDGPWSLDAHKDRGDWVPNGRNMGGFWILVDHESTYTATTSGTQPKVVGATEQFTDETYHKVTPPDPNEVAKAPQMICLTGDWHWPKERVNISGPYPEFETWLTKQDHKWYDSSNFPSNTVGR